MFWLSLAVLEEDPYNDLKISTCSFNREDRLIRDACIKKRMRNLASVDAMQKIDLFPQFVYIVSSE